MPTPNPLHSTKTMRSCFGNIPSEILYQILSHLPLGPLIRLCRASSCLAVMVQDYVQHSILCHHAPKSPYKLQLSVSEPALMTKHDDLELTYAGCLRQAEALGREAEKRAELRSDYSRFKVCSSRGMDSRDSSLDWAPTNGFSTVICLDELDSLYQFHTNMYYQKRGPRSEFFTGGREDLKTVRLWRNWLGSEEEEEEYVEGSPREKGQTIWTGCAPDAIGFTVSVQRHTPSGNDEDALQLSAAGGSRETCEFYKVTIGEVLVRNSYLLALRENLNP